MSNNNNLYSVIIPVYNAEKTLEELCERIRKVFDEVVKEKFEIILVNDASKDDSWNEMKKLHDHNNRIKIINLAKNFGQHAALLCGLNNFNGDFVIMLDDDLQHPPEEIPKLISIIQSNTGVDVVFGNYITKKHSLIRNIGSRTLNIISSRIFKKDPSIRITSFRIVRAEIAEKIAAIRIHKPRIGQLILYTTNRIATVAVEHNSRKYGSSGYTFSRLCKDFIISIISNSTLPLKAISLVGILLSFLSLLAGIYYIVRYFVSGTGLVGWTSLIVAVTFYSGFILFTLGIIGEYLIRILLEAKKLPNYVERDKCL